VKQAVALGIDEEQLTADLLAGETTTATATYFVLSNPISERPMPSLPRPEPEVAVTGGRPASVDSQPRQLPPIPPSPKRDRKIPLPGGTGVTVAAALPFPLIVPRRMSRPVCPVPQSKGGRRSVDLGKPRKG
jgi:hypothetical protein